MIERQELIGRNAELLYNGEVLSGTIVDETKNMLLLRTEGRIIKIIKKSAQIKIDGKIIDREKISKRPEERIKLK